MVALYLHNSLKLSSTASLDMLFKKNKNNFYFLFFKVFPTISSCETNSLFHSQRTKQ